MNTNLNDILTEWAYRLKDGTPYPKSIRDKIVLESVLKDFGWNVAQREELLRNLVEVDIVKNKDSGNIYTVKNVNKDKHTLVKKNASKDDIEKIEKDDDTDKKTDSKIDTKEFKSEIDKDYYDKDVDPSDEDYEKQKPEQLEFKEGTEPLKFSEEEIEFLATKFPKKYIKVLERIMNSKKTGTFEPNIKSFIDAAGAGQTSSTAGEIMTMMTVSMNDEQMSFLEQKLGEHWDNLADTVRDGDLILDRDWLESAKGVRAGVKERYDDYYGEGNWEVTGAAWDVPSDVEAMGFDYSKKGFSTDTYFRLKVNGQDVLDELSLKKDLDIALAQPGVNEAFYWALAQNKEDKERYDNIVKKKGELKSLKKTGTKEYKALTAEANQLLKKYENTLGEDGNPSKRTEKENKSSMDYLENLNQEKLELLRNAKDEDFDIPILKKTKTNKYMRKLRDELVKLKPPISPEQLNDVVKRVGGKGGQKYLNKATMITARLLGHLGDEDSKKHVDERIGITANFTKAYMNNIVKVPEIRDGIMSTIRDKFPLNALMSGEETMALGGVSADKKVMKEIFGTDDYDEVETNLEVDGPDDKGFYQLLYKVKGTDRVVNLSKLRARQRGLGYSTTPNFEMLIHEDFKGELYRANVSVGRDVYDPARTEKGSMKTKYGKK